MSGTFGSDGPSCSANSSRCSYYVVNLCVRCTSRRFTQKLADTLTVEQQEILARTSYAYWVAVTSMQEYFESRKDELRRKMCLREIRRHLVDWTFEYAAAALQKTCQYREEYRLDVLRTCFQEDVVYANEDDALLAQKYRSLISRDLALQSSVVRGHDKEDRAIILIFPRVSVEDYSDEAFIITQLYIMERAVACTEALSKGRQEKLVAVLDFGHFQYSHSPSLTAVKKLASTLQHRYPEHLMNLVVIDPPLWMRTMYTLVKPFLDPDTRRKFILVSGDKGKEQVLSILIDVDQAMPFMLPGGKLSDPVDIDRYTTRVPFHCLYDYKH